MELCEKHCRPLVRLSAEFSYVLICPDCQHSTLLSCLKESDQAWASARRWCTEAERLAEELRLHEDTDRAERDVQDAAFRLLMRDKG